MKISTILDHIDNGHLALPEFQRGYVWNRDQVRGLFDSLYRRHPVGGLLVWATESSSASHRGDGPLAIGIVKLLLDGQQRITSLYGVARGKPPKFFDGNSKVFTGLRFHLDSETFEFYQPVKMKDDSLWIDVTDLLVKGTDGIGDYVKHIATQDLDSLKLGEYMGRLSRLIGILDIDLHIEEVTGADKSLDVVVDIFNRVNSGGTKLSKGDLALAKICADWPEGRIAMQTKLKEWEAAGYSFSLDWLLRSVNTVLTGEAKFLHLHERTSAEVKDALHRASKHIDYILNLIAGRLGLDHDQVLFGRHAVPVMARYLDMRHQRKLGTMGEVERDQMLFWYAQAAMWGRFSGSTESFIDQDLEALEGGEGGLERLVEQLRLWHGSLRVEPGHFTGWSLGARFYPVLYMLTRMGSARDWGSGIPLSANMLGKMNRLEVHHIFPKSKLYAHGYKRAEVNALSNFCFLTKDTNLEISNRLPEDYFPEIEAAHPGALASQWVPMDPDLWKIERYREFLDARKLLLAEELNRRMEELIPSNTEWLGAERTVSQTSLGERVPEVVASEEIEAEGLLALNEWLASQGLAQGEMNFDFADPATGAQIAVFDLAWPQGLQEELGEPVALVSDVDAEVLLLANEAGYRCYSDIDAIRRHVSLNILGGINAS